VPIRAEEDPEFRTFFTELAGLCGRSVTAEEA
jgi:hypothetical protein